MDNRISVNDINGNPVAVAYLPSDPIDRQWQRLMSLIDPRCGKCGLKVRTSIEVVDTPGAPIGLLFKCHGQEDFLEVSEASFRVPKRFKGFIPFRDGLSKKECEQIEKQLFEERLAAAKSAREEYRRGVRDLTASQRAMLNDEIERSNRAMQLKSMGSSGGGGGTTAIPDPRAKQPSDTLTGFMERLLRDLRSGILDPIQVRQLAEMDRSSSAARIPDEPTPPPKPKPKPIELIVTNKPRIITLED